MNIQQVSFENFKGIKKGNIQLDGRSVVIFGINGVGKSTVLSAINIIFAQLINRITQNKFKQLINLENEDIKFGEARAAVEATIRINEEDFQYKRIIERKGNKRTHYGEILDEIALKFKEEYNADDLFRGMPIYANYGVHRAVQVVSVKRVHKKHDYFDKLSTYEKAIENKIDFRMFFEWFRDQQETEYIERIDGDITHVSRPLQAVKKAVLGMLSEEGFSDIKIMKDPIRMVAKKNNINLRIEQLSDGEKCTLAMIGDLARRLAIANPEMENPLDGVGIVLIDEIELHLHPTWQAKILSVLMRIFPNVQFIVTTHSPKVLGEVETDVLIYELSKKGSDVLISPRKSAIGRDANYILESLMDTRSINKNTSKIISDLFLHIDMGNFQVAQQLLSQLEELTDALQPDVISAKMLIKRGQLKK